MSQATEAARERLFRVVHGEFSVRRGHPLPYGSAVRRDGVNFAVFSRHATSLSLVLFAPGESEPVLELPLDPRYNKTGDVWHVLVEGVDPGVEYAFRAAAEPNPTPDVLRFDRTKLLIDPYGKAVGGLDVWGEVEAEKGRLERLRSRVIDEEFDWGHEHPLSTPLADSVIYEMHVRGFTRHPSSGVGAPGYLPRRRREDPVPARAGGHRRRADAGDGVRGVRRHAEEPSHRPSRCATSGATSRCRSSPPRPRTPAKGPLAHAAREFKEMVKALHEAGIEVILDMVFNHTAEGDERGATFCWRGLDNPTYYILEPKTGRYLNYSGCGNTMNCNHPVLRFQILAALRYWVTEMHVDGFRFDLASILGRGRDGEVLAEPAAPRGDRG